MEDLLKPGFSFAGKAATKKLTTEARRTQRFHEEISVPSVVKIFLPKWQEFSP
jgi:hypothetical protein